MIVKMMKRPSFGIVINYITRPDHLPHLIYSKGIRVNNNASIVKSFDRQSRVNPRISKPVLHCSFSFAIEDKAKVSPNTMIEVVKRWQSLMGFQDTQIAIFEHCDHEYQHCHVIFNRVGNNGKTLSDKNDRTRNAKACKTLVDEFGLYLAPGKRKINYNKLRNKDKAKYDILSIIQKLLLTNSDWQAFEKALNKEGIRMKFRYNKSENRILGIVFSNDKYSIAGSRIDSSLSFNRLNTQLKGLTYYNSSYHHSSHQTFCTNDNPFLNQRSYAQENESEPQSVLQNDETIVTKQNSSLVNLNQILNILIPCDDSPTLTVGGGGGGSRSSLRWDGKNPEDLEEDKYKRKRKR